MMCPIRHLSILSNRNFTPLSCCFITTATQVNFCAYFAKGVSDHVAVWDFDEFFIPKGGNENMLDAIDKAHSKGPLDSRISSRFTELEVPNSEWRGGPGWADGNAHPFCFLQMR